MPYSQPSIELLGIRIDEPVTVLTDLLITAACVFAFYRLHRLPVKGKLPAFFKYFFLTMGIACAVGGIIGHGFLYLFSFAWKVPGWIISMVSIALIERAAIFYARPLTGERLGRIFGRVNIIELVAFMIISLVTLNFFYVQAHAGYGLVVVVTSFCAYVYYHTRDAGSAWMLGGVGVSAIASLVYMNQWGIGPWFNHFDISHVFMAMATLLMYRGAHLMLMQPYTHPKEMALVYE